MVALSCALLVVGGLAAGRGSTPPACGPLRQVPAVGPACKTPEGLWRITAADGSTFLTHGADPPPNTVTNAYQITAPRKKPSCVSDPASQFHIEVFYAHAANTRSRYSETLSGVRAMVEVSNGIVSREASLFHRKLSLRVLCAGGSVDVEELTLKTSKSKTNLSTVIDDMRALGYNSPLVKYWVWFDGMLKGAGGTGTFINDGALSGHNHSMYGAGYAATWGYSLARHGYLPMLHEGWHNFGAVPFAAPHSTLGAHCTDGVDVMCYRDSGALRNSYRATVCTDRVWLDCRHNDYFNPKPSHSNFLASHWNVASPYNRFVAGCTYATGMLSAGLAGQDVDHAIPSGAPSHPPITTQARHVSSSCWGHPFAISVAAPPIPQNVHGVQGLIPGAAEDLTIGEDPTDVAERRAEAKLDVDACFYKGSKTLRCYTGTSDRGTVPSGATTVRVTLALGADAIYVFNAV